MNRLSINSNSCVCRKQIDLAASGRHALRRCEGLRPATARLAQVCGFVAGPATTWNRDQGKTQQCRTCARCCFKYGLRGANFSLAARARSHSRLVCCEGQSVQHGRTERSPVGCSSELRRNNKGGGSGPETEITVEPEVSTATIAREVERSFDTVLQELAAIQSDSPRNVAILGTRHCSYLHQQIIELLTFANVLLGNHVITSGGIGSNMAVIRGALRADKPELLTVVLPQSVEKQPAEVRELLERVTQVVEMKQNDSLPLDVASRLCNSDIISRADRFISFAFHDSEVVLEAAREAKALNKVVTLLYLD
jgi:hypothetical protein